MRTSQICLLYFLIIGNLAGQDDSIFVTIQSDTATIWHTQTQRNCGSSFVIDIQIEDTLITITEVDTGDIAYCDCYFDLSVTIGPLNSGTYMVDIFSTDSLYGTYWGSIIFTIEGLSDSVWVISQDQSDCYFPTYEGPIWYISTNGNNEIGDGSADNPFATIQYGIDVAGNGDTILVSPGIYYETINFLGKSIVVKSRDGPENTIIQAPNAGSVVTFSNGEDFNSVLEGFTITGGLGTQDSTEVELADFGGGIYIRSSSPTIRGNIITENYVTGSCAERGGGIAIKDSSDPLIINNTITDNSVIDVCDWINYFGGGIWVDSTSNPVIGGSEGQGNNIFNNTADYGYQLYRNGIGLVINAQFNYFGDCPPAPYYDIYPEETFDVSNCSDTILSLQDSHDNSHIPETFKLFQNTPNPFNSITNFRYDLPKQTYVTLEIYDILGREVRNLVQGLEDPGFKSVKWDGRNEFGETVSSGVYLYRIKTSSFTQTKKMIFLQ